MRRIRMGFKKSRDAPCDVLLSVEGEDIILKWNAPWNYPFSITLTGYKILKKSKHLAGGKWEIADQIMTQFKREYRVTLGSNEMCSYKVVAVYKDRESIGSEPQKVWDLDLSSPRDVLLSVEGEDIILKWDAPWNHSISITPTGYKILKKSKHLAGGKWEVADQITAEFKEYRVTLGSYEMYSYKVVAVYKDRESIGIEPQKVWDLDLSSPYNVLLSVEGEDVILKWDAPWNYPFFIPLTGYKILKKSKHLAGGKWEVAGQIMGQFIKREYRVTLGSNEMCSYKVVAVYKDRESIGIEPQKVWDLDLSSPYNVLLSVEGEDVILKWDAPWNRPSYITPTGYKILKKSKHLAGGKWEVAGQIMGQFIKREYRVTLGSNEMCSYKVVAVYKDRESIGREPQKDPFCGFWGVEDFWKPAFLGPKELAKQVWDLDLSPCDVIESVEGEDVREPQKDILLVLSMNEKIASETRVLKTKFKVLLERIIACVKGISDNFERDWLLKTFIKKVRSDGTVPNEYLSLSVDRLFSYMNLGRSLKWYKPSILKELAESVECLDEYEKYMKIFGTYLSKRIKGAVGQVELVGDKEWNKELLEGDLATISDIPALIHQICTSDPESNGEASISHEKWNFYFTGEKITRFENFTWSRREMVEGIGVIDEEALIKNLGIKGAMIRCDDIKQISVLDEFEKDERKYELPLLIVTKEGLSDEDIKKIVRSQGLYMNNNYGKN